MKKLSSVFAFVFLVLLVVGSRLLAHDWNFTVAGAVFLLAGAYFADKKISMLLMLTAMLVSDALIGFHNQMLVVYFGYALYILIAAGALKISSSRLKVVGISLLASVAFYLVTNFGVWYEGKLYALNLSGLVACYAMGLPFFQNQLIADVFGSLLLFESVRLYQSSAAKSKA
jgi:hypothetical protein